VQQSIILNKKKETRNMLKNIFVTEIFKHQGLMTKNINMLKKAVTICQIFMVVPNRRKVGMMNDYGQNILPGSFLIRTFLISTGISRRHENILDYLV